MPLPDSNITPGTPVRVLDAYGEWLDRVAVSGVHAAGPCDECGRHDFAVVFVARQRNGDSIPWPLEDVRVAL